MNKRWNIIPIKLVQLVETLHLICKGPEFESKTPHLFVLRGYFLVTKLLLKKMHVVWMVNRDKKCEIRII